MRSGPVDGSFRAQLIGATTRVGSKRAAIGQTTASAPAVSAELQELIDLGLAIAPMSPLDTASGDYIVHSRPEDSWGGYTASRREQVSTSVDNISADAAKALLETYKEPVKTLAARIVEGDDDLAAAFDAHYGLKDLFAVLDDKAQNKTAQLEMLGRADMALVRLGELASVLQRHPTEGEQTSKLIADFQMALLENARGRGAHR